MRVLFAQFAEFREVELRAVIELRYAGEKFWVLSTELFHEIPFIFIFHLVLRLLLGFILVTFYHETTCCHVHVH